VTGIIQKNTAKGINILESFSQELSLGHQISLYEQNCP